MNPYEILGVDRNATKEDIKKSFKEKARKWHPDINKEEGAEEKFKEINEAYQTLTNPNARSNPRNPLEHADFDDFVDLEDFIRRQHSHNVVKNVGQVGITLEEVMVGVQKKIDISEKSPCVSCNGVGLELTDESCSHCNGLGGTEINRGVMRIRTSCGACRGTGKQPKGICDICKGSKINISTEQVEVNIPKGVNHGSLIHLKDDYIATVVHLKHPVFERTMFPLDLSQTVKIDWLDALLGTKINVETLDGIKKLKIKPVVQQDSTMRMKNNGLVDEAGSRGNMFINIEIQMPEELSEKQIELLEEIRRENG